MKHCVVLDINVFASAVASSRGTVWAVVQMGLRKEYDLAVSDHILVGLRIVLTRPYFLQRVSETQREELIAALVDIAEPFSPDPAVTGIAGDDEDDLVLGTAVAANADFLVTGDAGLLRIGEYRGVQIVTPRKFLEILDAQLP